MDLDKYLSQPGQNAAALARELRIPAPLLSQWRHGRPVPVKRCSAIEKATKGGVTRQDLRPDDWHTIWPELKRKRGARHGTTKD